jgi:hypothetical protein
MRVCSAGINACQRDPVRPKSLTDHENYGKRSLHDPVLKIEHAQTGEYCEAQECEQLISPLHQRDLSARDLHCQSRSKPKNRLLSFGIIGRVRYGEPCHADHS